MKASEDMCKRKITVCGSIFGNTPMLKLGWWEKIATRGAININTKIKIIVTRIFACRITARLVNLKDPSSSIQIIMLPW